MKTFCVALAVALLGIGFLYHGAVTQLEAYSRAPAAAATSTAADLARLSLGGFGGFPKEDPQARMDATLDALLKGQLHGAAQLAELESLLRQKLVTDQDKLLAEQAKVAESLSNLAGVVKDLKRRTDPVRSKPRAVVAERTLFAPDRLDTDRDLDREPKGSSRAEQLLRRGLGLDLKRLRADYASVSRDLYSLGRLLQDEKRPTGAEPWGFSDAEADRILNGLDLQELPRQ